MSGLCGDAELVRRAGPATGLTNGPDKVGQDKEQPANDGRVAAAHHGARHLGRRRNGAVQIGELGPQRIVRELRLEDGIGVRARCG